MKRRQCLFLGLSAAIVPSLWTPAQAEWHTIGSSLTEAEVETVLKMHNTARAEVGVAPLVWSKELAQFAQVWAEQLARENEFKHSDVPYGENLAGAHSVEQAMQLWLDEKQQYRHGSKGRDFAQTGHYTQMVWSQTKRVGCGKASGKDYDIYVCNYDPRGNMMGEDPY